jgi:predicted DNA-binding transcriptional regulator AlpA
LAPDLRLTDNEAEEIIKKTCGISELKAFDTLLPKHQLKYIEAVHDKGCSIRQLVRLTGMSKARVERILKKSDKPSPYHIKTEREGFMMEQQIYTADKRGRSRLRKRPASCLRAAA